MKKQQSLENIKLNKFVHGGQCLAEAPDGRKLFVWGGLPDELVNVQITKKKSSYLEGIVTYIHSSSKNRIEPKEPDTYLSTSPWQIMKFDYENISKQAILEETFTREGVVDIKWQDFYAGTQEYGYRNKVEFGFWGDEQGIHLAQYVRGTHGKQIISGSVLAMSEINEAVVHFINKFNKWAEEKGIRAGDLKTVVFRASQAGDVVAALFIKKQINCSTLALSEGLKGISVYYSNPKSPASVPTKLLYTSGDIKLQDSIMGKNIIYDVMSFFQVNLPVFEQALTSVKSAVTNISSIDMYSGVGTIGLAVGASKLIESDKSNIAMAHINAQSIDAEVICASSESALEHITATDALIVDPPRAGLHKNVVERILEALPPKIVYLSCNPASQARDISALSEKYNVIRAQGYNFFPRTPHIESLIVLDLVA